MSSLRPPPVATALGVRTAHTDKVSPPASRGAAAAIDFGTSSPRHRPSTAGAASERARKGTSASWRRDFESKIDAIGRPERRGAGSLGSGGRSAGNASRGSPVKDLANTIARVDSSLQRSKIRQLTSSPPLRRAVSARSVAAPPNSSGSLFDRFGSAAGSAAHKRKPATAASGPGSAFAFGPRSPTVGGGPFGVKSSPKRSGQSSRPPAGPTTSSPVAAARDRWSTSSALQAGRSALPPPSALRFGGPHAPGGSSAGGRGSPSRSPARSPVATSAGDRRAFINSAPKSWSLASPTAFLKKLAGESSKSPARSVASRSPASPTRALSPPPPAAAAPKESAEARRLRLDDLFQRHTRTTPSAPTSDMTPLFNRPTSPLRVSSAATNDGTRAG